MYMYILIQTFANITIALKPLHNIGKIKKPKFSQIYT